MAETIQSQYDSAGSSVCRVMIVDDSAAVRGLITRSLESDPTIKVIASAGDGEMAVRLASKHKLDVVVLDIEMPIMNGLEAIPQLLKVDPNLKIIMASNITLANAETSIRALELGAADYIPKPSSSREMTGADDFKRELIGKVKALANTHVVTPSHNKPTEPVKALYSGELTPFKLRDAPITMPYALAIGSSTGGPQALFEVLAQLKGVEQPIFITQHMPATFTTILAQHITRQCGLTCVEAAEGEIIEGGKVYLAPGDRHLTLRRFGNDLRITLNQDPPENFCRPAVDPMLRSLSSVFGPHLLVAILTGMGNDGMKGAETVIAAGGSVIAQDQPTSVVWGMPGAVATAGLCSAVMPLNNIGPFLRTQAQRGLR